jgi:hypothetical protein
MSVQSTPSQQTPQKPSQSASLSGAEKHRRAQLYARLTYVGIICVFLTVCAIAVLATMKHEREKEGFRAIHLKKPISFFDYTYVDKPSPAQPPKRP